MFPNIPIFLLFLVSSCFSQFDQELTKESTDSIRDLLVSEYFQELNNVSRFIKVRGQNGTLLDFRSFSKLLDQRQFFAYYGKQKFMGYHGFLHFLKTQRRTFSEVELMPEVYQNITPQDYFELRFTLKLSNIMKYTVTERYCFEIKFSRDGELRIVKLDVDLEDGPESTWESTFLGATDLKARNFAQSMSELPPDFFIPDFHFFFANKVDFAEGNFMALIDTDYENILNLDDFMIYMARFSQKYGHQQGSEKNVKILTEANDHIVFQIGVPIKHSNKTKRWNFEVEAAYIQNSWKILKIFVRHPFDDNMIIMQRAVIKLYTKLKYEFKNLLKVSNVIEIPKVFTGKVKKSSYNICELFLVPGNDTKIKLPIWTGKVEILGIHKYNTIIIQLYHPDERRLVNIHFRVVYNTILDVSEIVRITVQCPEREHLGLTNFKDSLLDLEPFVVINKQVMLEALLQHVNETIPFNNPESDRDLFASNFTAITTIYPDQSYEHNWDSFKKFMRIFNGKYLYINTSSECSFGRAGARIISQENSRATFEVLKIFKFEYEEAIEDQQMDLWKFVFEVNWDSSGAWKIQRLLINPINKVGKYRAVLAVQGKTQTEVERIAKLPVRKLFFDSEWAEYFQTMYSKLYGGNVPWQLNSTFIFDKYNIHRTRPLTTIFEHSPEDAPADFSIIVEADDNSRTVRLPIKIYCIYIEEYDNYFIRDIFVQKMVYA